MSTHALPHLVHFGNPGCGLIFEGVYGCLKNSLNFSNRARADVGVIPSTSIRFQIEILNYKGMSFRLVIIYLIPASQTHTKKSALGYT